MEENIDNPSQEVTETTVEQPTTEDRVYAGKFKSSDELEKGYKELEGKIGNYRELEEASVFLQNVLNDPDAYKQARQSLGLEEAAEERREDGINPQTVIDEARRTSETVARRESLLNKVYSKYSQLDPDAGNFDAPYKAMVESYLSKTDGRKSFVSRVEEAVNMANEYLGKNVQAGVEAEREVAKEKAVQAQSGRQSSEPSTPRNDLQDRLASSDQKVAKKALIDYLKDYNKRNFGLD